MATTSKFTERNAWEEVLTLETASETLKTFATERIAKLDEKNEKRKNSEKTLAKQAADAELREAMVSVMEAGKTYAAAELGVALTTATGTEVSNMKASSLAKTLVEAGTLVQSDIRYDGRKVKGYTLA